MRKHFILVLTDQHSGQVRLVRVCFAYALFRSIVCQFVDMWWSRVLAVGATLKPFCLSTNVHKLHKHRTRNAGGQPNMFD